MKWGGLRKGQYHLNDAVSSTRESNRLKSDVFGVQKSKTLKFSAAPFSFFSIEEARIHAHLCGDGSVWREYRKQSPADLASHKRRNPFREFWWLNYTNTRRKLRDEFEDDMIKAFKRKLWQHQTINLKAGSVKKILIRLKLLGKNSHNWFIPEEILFARKLVKSYWLQAFFDDEATVSIEKKSIRLKIVNHSGLLQIQTMLQDLGILSNITGPNIDN